MWNQRGSSNRASEPISKIAHHMAHKLVLTVGWNLPGAVNQASQVLSTWASLLASFPRHGSWIPIAVFQKTGIEDASISRQGSRNWLAVSCAKFYWSQNPLRFMGREHSPHPLVEGVSSNLSSYSL